MSGEQLDAAAVARRLADSLEAHGTRTLSLMGRPIRVLSPEDMAILKLFFNRGKDWVDVERLVARQGASLDRSDIRRWLVDGVAKTTNAYDAGTISAISFPCLEPLGVLRAHHARESLVGSHTPWVPVGWK